MDRFRSIFIVLNRFDRVHLFTSEDIIKFTRFTISTRITKERISFVGIVKNDISHIETHSHHNLDKCLDSQPLLNSIEDIGMSSIPTSTRRMLSVATRFRRNVDIQWWDSTPRSEWSDRCSHPFVEDESIELSYPTTICWWDYSWDRQSLGLRLDWRRIESFSRLCDVGLTRSSFESSQWKTCEAVRSDAIDLCNIDLIWSIVISTVEKECCSRLVDDNEDKNHFPRRTKDSTRRPKMNEVNERQIDAFGCSTRRTFDCSTKIVFILHHEWTEKIEELKRFRSVMTQFTREQIKNNIEQIRFNRTRRRRIRIETTNERMRQPTNRFIAVLQQIETNSSLSIIFDKWTINNELIKRSLSFTSRVVTITITDWLLFKPCDDDDEEAGGTGEEMPLITRWRRDGTNDGWRTSRRHRKRNGRTDESSLKQNSSQFDARWTEISSDDFNNSNRRIKVKEGIDGRWRLFFFSLVDADEVRRRISSRLV